MQSPASPPLPSPRRCTYDPPAGHNLPSTPQPSQRGGDGAVAGDAASCRWVGGGRVRLHPARRTRRRRPRQPPQSRHPHTGTTAHLLPPPPCASTTPTRHGPWPHQRLQWGRAGLEGVSRNVATPRQRRSPDRLPPAAAHASRRLASSKLPPTGERQRGGQASSAVSARHTLCGGGARRRRARAADRWYTHRALRHGGADRTTVARPPTARRRLPRPRPDGLVGGARRPPHGNALHPL